jgi:hypothetical protein
MFEIILWGFTVFLGIGCILFLWEYFLNLKTVAQENRPEFFNHDLVAPYQMYGLLSTIFIPWLAVWKWGWIGLLAYQIYPLACAIVAGIFTFYTLRQIKTTSLS